MSQSQSDIYDTHVGYVEDEPQVYKGPAIPVYIDPKYNDVERVAPDFGSTGTFILQLPGQAQPVQVLQRRERRNKARIYVASFGGTAVANFASITASGNATNPGAGTNIVQVTVPQAGFYSINWATILAGTLGATDRSNVQLFINVTPIQTSMNGINTGTYYPQLPAQVFIPAGAVVSMTVTNANAAAVYSGDISITPITSIGAATAAQFHNRPDVLSNPNPPPNVGITIVTAPFSFDWESQQPLFGVGISGLVTVSVVDETYAEA